jgi:hypothetical protein
VLAQRSKKHDNRLKEIIAQANEFYGIFDSNQEADGLIRRRLRKNDSIHSIFFFLEHITNKVEVIANEKNLDVYFPKYPATFLMSEASKEEYRQKCDISDANTKCLGLMQNYEVFEYKMETQLKFYRENRLIYRCTSEGAFLLYLRILYCFGVCACIITALGLVSEVTTKTDTGSTYRWIEDSEYRTAAGFFEWLNIILSFICLLFYEVRRPAKILEKTTEFKIAYPNLNANIWYYKWSIIVFDAFLLVPFVSNSLLHILFSFMGMVHNPVWATLQLILMVNISQTAKDVARSVYQHADQLITTFILALSFIFIFAGILLVNFQSEYAEDYQTLACDRLVYCFIDAVNYGFRMGGGLGDLQGVFNRNHGNYAGLTAFQLLAFIIVNVIFLNVIFGIIIDTFSALREEAQARKEDIENVCFICGFTNVDFSKKNADFDHHLTEEHDPWTYVNFIYHMKKTGISELNGLEQFSYDCYSALNTQWLPIGKTRFLEADDDAHILEHINKNTKVVKKYMKKFDK